MKTHRVNYYQSIHKTLRRLLFLFSIDVGCADFTQETDILNLSRQFTKIKNMLEVHSKHEEKFLHPFIQEQLPNAFQNLDKTHECLENTLQEIEPFFGEIKNAVDNTMKQNIGWSLYLAVNRFIADYLVHLDEEESEVMPALWEKCDDAELLEPLSNLIANIPHEKYIPSLQDFLEAISPQEQALMLKHS